jgi:hypothetical protein
VYNATRIALILSNLPTFVRLSLGTDKPESEIERKRKRNVEKKLYDNDYTCSRIHCIEELIMYVFYSRDNPSHGKTELCSAVWLYGRHIL